MCIEGENIQHIYISHIKVIRLWSQRDQHWNKQVAVCCQHFTCMYMLSRAMTRICTTRICTPQTCLVCGHSLTLIPHQGGIRADIQHLLALNYTPHSHCWPATCPQSPHNCLQAPLASVWHNHLNIGPLLKFAASN